MSKMTLKFEYDKWHLFSVGCGCPASNDEMRDAVAASIKSSLMDGFIAPGFNEDKLRISLPFFEQKRVYDPKDIKVQFDDKCTFQSKNRPKPDGEEYECAQGYFDCEIECTGRIKVTVTIKI